MKKKSLFKDDYNLLSPFAIVLLTITIMVLLAACLALLMLPKNILLP